MQNLPGPLREVVEQLSSLPGIGPKSALRIALTLLKMPRERAGGVGQSILDLREKLCLCDDCACLAEASPCAICGDPARDSDQLCLVPEWDALLAMEDMGVFRGKYLVLGGLLSPLDGVEPGHLEIERLRRHLGKGTVSEVILALGTTLDAESTASYIKNLVESEFSEIRVSRLAQGIPVGAEVKFMDKETLKQSLVYRQKV
ncbi:recombination mediator RecR [Pseudodesulfovibrio piezophilus]|uniref:Recombination protein RecR n=1 Tax=Pseudodesulfovibrio piezophilus (strain DSM 21447 / JCM 15486 / C1TLV30) TaxID=1322246 RepID=M1WUK3_PSEP2|nr:recombination mediator RecR [Pseudodesulfovibrio piezophilus]CCH47488.1 Recombination protein recR [Pseudodesulfovibrio piezophilus C1TLV30]